MNRKNTYYLKALLFLCFVYVPNVNAQDAEIWQKYTGENTDAGIPDLPNYSYAGYKLGQEAIPTSNATVFDITDYGAEANDDKSDVDAIKAAIAAAESAGGGVVFFPPGEFLVNTETEAGNYESIAISGSNIVLRGSGSGPGGTVINMKNVMKQEPGKTQLHQCNPMFNFAPTYGHSGPTNIIADSDKGSNYITVENPNKFGSFKYVRMDMAANKAANSLYLDGKTNLNSIWTNIVNKGVVGKEFHEIDHIDGNKVYFKDELIDDIKAAHGWTVEGWKMIEESGFEDIHFKGNFTDTFVHHKDYVHDGGWRPIGLSSAAHCYVRRSRFTNVSFIASTGHSYASSIIQILLDGNRGHSTVDIGGSSRILVGLIWDNVDGGQFHGVNVSGSTTGSVAWRIDATNGRGMDFHGSSPRSNLYDVYNGYDVVGNGGSVTALPNHLGGLTLWNHSRVGPKVSNYDFWWFCGRDYCAAVVANPIIVGYHGSETSFLQKNVKYEESNGTKVSPESLYEAQVEYRLGSKPAWIDPAITEYYDLKTIWYNGSLGPIESDYTETINNLTLNDWGKVSYTGDNGFIWNVDAKGANNYIEASKGIYFQKGTTGITSDQIRGGIGSFSVQCKDLWDAGVERKIELLINGDVVGSMTHTGGEIYTFSVADINIEGYIKIAIRNASEQGDNSTIAIDNIYWTTYAPTASVEDNSFRDVKIYPNPSNSGLFTVKLNLQVTAKIYDLRGRVIKDATALDNAENELDISEYNSGIYILTLDTDNGATKTFKLINK